MLPGLSISGALMAVGASSMPECTRHDLGCRGPVLLHEADKSDAVQLCAGGPQDTVRAACTILPVGAPAAAWRVIHWWHQSHYRLHPPA